MKNYRVIQKPVDELLEVVCDRCGKSIAVDDFAYAEILSIDTVCGYGSIFGDGHRLRLDFCQECVKDTLGKWLRVEVNE